jgi:hypothetical protein
MNVTGQVRTIPGMWTSMLLLALIVLTSPFAGGCAVQAAQRQSGGYLVHWPPLADQAYRVYEAHWAEALPPRGALSRPFAPAVVAIAELGEGAPSPSAVRALRRELGRRVATRHRRPRLDRHATRGGRDFWE